MSLAVALQRFLTVCEFAKQTGLIVLTSHAESSIESVTADVADIKVSEPTPSHSKPVPDTSTSAGAASAHKHDDTEEEETETAEDRAKREAELSKIYADLAKEDDRCWLVVYHHCCSSCACYLVARSPFHAMHVNCICSMMHAAY